MASKIDFQDLIIERRGREGFKIREGDSVYAKILILICNTANSSNIIEVLEINKVEFWSRKVKGNIFISGQFHEILKRNSSMFIGK